MVTALRTGLRAAATAAVLGVGALIPAAAQAAPAPAGDTCPAGQVEDTTTPGFQCVTACPSGMLLDGVTGVCVAAPGVPPPPLR